MLKHFSRKWNRSKTLLTVAILLSPLLLHATTGFAKTEEDIKAAYLYNLMKFIAWPSIENQNEFNLCVIGDDPVNEKLIMLESRPIHKLNIHVEHFYTLNSETKCDVVFIGESERKFTDKIIQFYARTPTLTVSSMEGFVRKGGMIGFITLGNIIRFDINLKQAKETQLSISSKLLELANQVEQ
tara:strand:+ start:62091 stop:62642 length:552 start_codon:yes stop_codon:yes gene_type:complete